MGITKKILCVAAFALAALALAACGSGGSTTGGSATEGLIGSNSGDEGGTLLGAYAAFPDYLDPALSHTGEGWTAMYDTYIPLLTYAHASGVAGGKVIPGLAAGMPEVTDNGKTYTLKLRKGLKYSNGEPVVASDFTHSLERVYLLNSSGSPFYDDIVGAEAFAKTKKGGIPGVETNDKTDQITIHLTRPRGTFENELALPFVALLPAKTPDEDLSANPPPATGPYVITSSKPGSGWEYERNPQWAKANGKLMPQIPSGHVDKIKIEVLRNPQTEVNEVVSGSLDWMANQVPPDRYQEILSKYESSQFRVEPTISTYFFWMNTTVAPFNDVKVRQAVNYAIDPRALERIYSGRLEGSQQILPTGMPGGTKLNLYPHDVKKAKELIAEANPSDREITVWTESEPPSNDVGAYYQGVLQELGFKVTLKVLGPDNYFTVIGNSSTPDLDTGWANWFEDYPHPNDFFQPLLSEESIAPTNGTNLARFADPPLSQKITELGEEPLGPTQEAAYAQLDKEFMEQAPLAPYGSSTASTFVSSSINLENVVYNPTFGQDLASFEFK
ncbi:MAG TPA: ABC transporter substrate-binding protein [Solirubrobacterales bacterium]|nr:ABC transporter substrate-binding protein [Solirubrobacterales bacterium]